MLLQILFFSALGSLGAVLASASLLIAPLPWVSRVLPALLSYATGTLLAGAFLGMLPASLALAPASVVGATVLAGFVLFFILEKWLMWRNCHAPDCAMHVRSSALILIGDAMHNFVDGVVIAAAFLTSPTLGVATAVAVIAHEIPQEVGDFGILLNNGLSGKRALLWNSLSASATFPGALCGYYLLGQTQAVLPYILSLSAASFIYIASADLMPRLHKEATSGQGVRQLLLLLAGIATIALVQAGCAK